MPMSCPVKAEWIWEWTFTTTSSGFYIWTFSCPVKLHVSLTPNSNFSTTCIHKSFVLANTQSRIIHIILTRLALPHSTVMASSTDNTMASTIDDAINSNDEFHLTAIKDQIFCTRKPSRMKITQDWSYNSQPAHLQARHQRSHHHFCPHQNQKYLESSYLGRKEQHPLLYNRALRNSCWRNARSAAFDLRHRRCRDG